jgi:predicted metal-binding protein
MNKKTGVKMKEYPEYLKLAKKLGADEAKIIPAESVVTAEWVRLKCQFGCGVYGQRLTCPPRSPSPERTKRMLADYSHAILVHGDRYTELREVIADLERVIFLDGHHRAFGMGAGPCKLCSECPDFCRYPDRARPAMEACGIDVYSTVRANGFSIGVVKKRGSRTDYYGMVLID